MTSPWAGQRLRSTRVSNGTWERMAPKCPSLPTSAALWSRGKGFEPVRIGPQRRCTFTGYLIQPIASDLFSPDAALAWRKRGRPQAPPRTAQG